MVLSPKQVHVLTGKTLGWTDQAIADQAMMSVNTIKTHLRLAYRALGAVNAPHAVIVAVERGYIHPRTSRGTVVVLAGAAERSPVSPKYRRPPVGSLGGAPASSAFRSTPFGKVYTKALWRLRDIRPTYIGSRRDYSSSGRNPS